MALKALMLRRKIDDKQKELAELRAASEALKTRETELERAIAEAETEEEKAAVEQMVGEFEADKAANDQAIKDAEAMVTEMTDELNEIEAEPEPNKAPMPTAERKEDNRMNTRVKFFGMNAEERDAFFARDDVKSFLEQVRSIGKNKTRSISGADLTIPEVVLGLIRENVLNYSKLLNRVSLRQVNGKARAPIMGPYQEAVWTEACASLNELTFSISDVEVDGYMIGGIIYICKAILEDSDLNLANEIITALGVGIGMGIDRAIIYGTGVKMPLGIVPRLAQDSKPSDYPATARPWVDLSESNIINLGDVSGLALFQAIVRAAGNAKGKYSRGGKFWAMNEATYTTLIVEAMGVNAAGAIVSAQSGTMPIVGGDIIVLSDDIIPDGNIVGGYGDLYMMAERAGSEFERADQYRFKEVQIAFRGTARYDGKPAIPEGFVAMAINSEPATSSVFPGDDANDATLADLTVGGTQMTSFAPGTLSYSYTGAAASEAVNASPTQPEARVMLAYNGKNYPNGATIKWLADSTAHPLTVTVKNGASVLTYTINVTRASG